MIGCCSLLIGSQQKAKGVAYHVFVATSTFCSFSKAIDIGGLLSRSTGTIVSLAHHTFLTSQLRTCWSKSYRLRLSTEAVFLDASHGRVCFTRGNHKRPRESRILMQKSRPFMIEIHKVHCSVILLLPTSRKFSHSLIKTLDKQISASLSAFPHININISSCHKPQNYNLQTQRPWRPQAESSPSTA